MFDSLYIWPQWGSEWCSVLFIFNCSTLSLNSLLIRCLWLCLSPPPPFHPAGSHENAFQQPFRGCPVGVLRTGVSLWTSLGFKGDQHNPDVYNPHWRRCFICCRASVWGDVILGLVICDTVGNAPIASMSVSTDAVSLCKFILVLFLGSVESEWEVPEPLSLHTAPAVLLLLL